MKEQYVKHLGHYYTKHQWNQWLLGGLIATPFGFSGLWMLESWISNGYLATTDLIVFIPFCLCIFLWVAISKNGWMANDKEYDDEIKRGN